MRFAGMHTRCLTETESVESRSLMRTASRPHYEPRVLSNRALETSSQNPEKRNFSSFERIKN